MTELLAPTPERKLWHKGPNYTADAVIIDFDTAKILLIERSDGGGWALPGGFVDSDDTSGYKAAAREAQEEASITVDGDAPCIFKGIVDDPRNSERAWIETEAYLFQASSEAQIAANDDAIDARWHLLDDLPSLYASHRAIVERAIDYMRSRAELRPSQSEIIHVDGGHMQYDKFIIGSGDQQVFCKQFSPANYTDPVKAGHSLLYLQKEASSMAHVRNHSFTAIPQASFLEGNLLAMEAFTPEDGWRWRAPTDSLNDYIDEAVDVFSSLEQLPFPADVHDIVPTYTSLHEEGWHGFTSETVSKVRQTMERFHDRLRPETVTSAERLLATLPSLQHQAMQLHVPSRFVFSHHDARQANIAWHPEYGIKLVDWSWCGAGEPGSDITNLLIDLHKSGHDISPYYQHINQNHCLTLIGFWLEHSTWPPGGDEYVRLQQLLSAISGFELLERMN